MTILVGRHFQSEMLPIAIFNQKCCQTKDRPKKPRWDTFLVAIFQVNQKLHFIWRAFSTHLRASSMTLLQREAQNLLHSRFSCMLISFLMLLLDSDQGKVKYSPLYGQGSKVTILVCRHFQSEMLPIKRSSKKNLVGTHFC